jgi:hypothetical protein
MHRGRVRLSDPILHFDRDAAENAATSAFAGSRQRASGAAPE